LRIFGAVFASRPRMSSINEQQPENNHENLVGPEAVEKIRELVGKSGTCFFCTDIARDRAIPTRPMSIQEVDDQGRLWFLSASDSSQNKEIERDAKVQIMLQGSAHSDFLTLYGRAEITRDKKKIDELWQPIVKTWFTQGKDDPRVTVICVTPLEGYYWDTKHNRFVVLAKMVAGAITGKTLDDSIEGKLRV
ncbi:MAG TPA: pyridoxamine 5'-phosphate oxidase family protein, partial [Kofleriaceae bacterium]